MTSLEQFRQKVTEAIHLFRASNDAISLACEQHIADIEKILHYPNPLQIRLQLEHYTQGLSSAILFWLWPFFEETELRYALQCVLDLPQFQENAILKRMLLDAGINLLDVPAKPCAISEQTNLEGRVHRLEEMYNTMKADVSQLRAENDFLTETLKLLSAKNTELTAHNTRLQAEKEASDQARQRGDADYQRLLQENAALKEQLRHCTCHPVSQNGRFKTEAVRSSHSSNLGASTC